MKNAFLSLASISLCLIAGSVSADPLVEWNFNGGTPGTTFVSAADTSGEIIATADGFGTTLYAEERPGGTGDSSVELDGFGFLRVPDHPALSGFADESSALDSLEIRAWINPTIPHTGPAQIVRKTDTMGYELFLIGDNEVGFSVHGIGGSSTVFALDQELDRIQLPWDEWVELVGKWDAQAGTISISVGGLETVEVANTQLVPKTNNFLGIGALIRTNNTTGQFFMGKIDDVSISGTVGPLEPPPPLVEIARWDMEGTVDENLDPIDGALDDYVGFEAIPENLGASTSLTYVAQPRPGSDGSTAANFNNPGTGNNNGAILILEDHPSQTGHFNDGPGYEAYELDMWIRPAELGRPMVLFRKTDDGEVGFFVMIQGNGTILVRHRELDGIVTSLASVGSLAVGEWYNIRTGFNPSTLYLNINDSDWETPRVTGSGNMVNTVTNLGIGGLIRVGNTSKGQYYNGLMDEVVIRAAVVDETSLEMRGVVVDTIDSLHIY